MGIIYRAIFKIWSTQTYAELHGCTTDIYSHSHECKLNEK